MSSEDDSDFDNEGFVSQLTTESKNFGNCASCASFTMKSEAGFCAVCESGFCQECTEKELTNFLHYDRVCIHCRDNFNDVYCGRV